MKRFLNFFLTIILLLAPAVDGRASDFPEASIGVIVVTHSTVEGYFMDEPTKPVALKDVPFNCNGFLVEKDGKIYFVSVKHILTKYANSQFNYSGKAFTVTKDDKADKVYILLPEIKNEFLEIPLSDENKFEVPETWYGLKNGTADAMAVDVTTNLKGLNLDGKVVPYEALVGISDRDMMNKQKRIMIMGYPGGDFNKGLQKKEGDWNQEFGKSLPLDTQQLRGFYFGIELSGGDCGSPVFLSDGNGIYIIGLMRTGLSGQDLNEFPSIATDSIVLRDAINRKEMS